MTAASVMRLLGRIVERLFVYALLGATVFACVGIVQCALLGVAAVFLMMLLPSRLTAPALLMNLIEGLMGAVQYGPVIGAVVGGIASPIVGIVTLFHPDLSEARDVIEPAFHRAWRWPLVGGVSGALTGVMVLALWNAVFANNSARSWAVEGIFYGLILGYSFTLFAAILTGGLSKTRRPHTP